jgi:2,4-diketo-3-deoxy-L-fuconate hydrolase
VRIANYNGRAVFVEGTRFVDIERESEGRFPSDPQRIFGHWEALGVWHRAARFSYLDQLDHRHLGPVTPRPGQIFAIGLNYRDHAEEANFALPSSPAVFTKFASALAGPSQPVTLPLGGDVDWEVEIVAVVGRTCQHVSEQDAWDYVAGLTLGQDISERKTQLEGPVPQFSLGKSFAGFAPIGPWVVSTDELADKDNIQFGCTLNEDQMQAGTTADMVFSIPELISRLSAVVTLNPGDIVFTGTPAGVGASRNPQRFLAAGDRLRSYADGIGQMDHTFVSSTNEKGGDCR